MKVSKIKQGRLSQYTDIHEGFIITRVNNQKIYSIDDLNKVLSNGSSGNGVLIEGKYPGDPQTYYYAFGL